MQPTFWAFSNSIYAEAGVAACCGELQDGHGADVNLVLFALWTASRGESLGQPGILAAEQATTPWRQSVVAPLRAVRRQLRDGGGQGAGPLREMVAGAELEAERLEQEMLATIPRPLSDLAARDLARANLAAYAVLMCPPPDPARFAPLLDAFARVAA